MQYPSITDRMRGHLPRVALSGEDTVPWNRSRGQREQMKHEACPARAMLHAQVGHIGVFASPRVLTLLGSVLPEKASPASLLALRPPLC